MNRTARAIIITIICTTLVLIIGFLGVTTWVDHRIMKQEIALRQLYQDFEGKVAHKNYEGAVQAMQLLLNEPKLSVKQRFWGHIELCDLYANELNDQKRAESACLEAINLSLPEPLASDRDILHIRAKMLRRVAIIQDESGRSAESRNHFKAALDIAEKIDEQELIHTLEESLGLVSVNLEDAVRAKYYYSKVLARVADKKPVGAPAFNARAFMYRHTQEYDKALLYGLLGIKAAKASNDDITTAMISDTVADIYLAQNDYAKALPYAEAAAMAKVEGRTALSEATEIKTYARALAGVGRTQEACSQFTRSQDIFSKIANETEVTRVQQLKDQSGC